MDIESFPINVFVMKGLVFDFINFGVLVRLIP